MDAPVCSPRKQYLCYDLRPTGGSLRSVVANVSDCDIIVSEFEL